MVAATVILLAAVALTFPIYYFGMPDGNDLPQHFRFIYTFYDAVHNGDFYPAWGGTTNLGFGDAGIRFYPPLAYYAVVLFRSVTESWTTTLAMAICFWFFIGGLGVFLLARESFSARSSTAAALVFMAMPYHANQIYNAGLFAEFAGLAILPYCFLFVRRVISGGRILDIAGLAVACALLILAHLPLAIIGSIGLTVYTIAMLDTRALGMSLVKLGSSVLMALAASSFYWVRMVSELSFVSHTRSEFTGQTYDFRQNFLGSIFYLSPGEYAKTSGWFTDLLFAITLAMILPALAVLILQRKRIDRRTVVPFLAVVTVAILISTPLGSPLWSTVESLQRIQFPWRFLGLISLAGSLLIAASLDELPALFRTKLRPVGLIAVGMIVAGTAFTAAQVVRPANYLSRIEFDEHFEKYRSDESYECWWPVWADHQALSNRERVTPLSRAVEVAEWKSDDRSFVVTDGPETELRIAMFYYPFWNATVNGQATSVKPADDGTLLIAVPAQRSTVRLFFAQPVYETRARYTSLVISILLAMGAVISLVTKLNHPKLV